MSGGGSTGGTSSVGSRASLGTMGMATQDDYEPESNFESNCTTDLIEYLKSTEKFSAKAYEDVSQWSIGYGIKTNNRNEVIDEAEASRRLVSRVNADRSVVIAYGKSYGYIWTDCQIDALTSFVYNLGTGSLSQVTNAGTRSNSEIAYAMTQYNKSGGQVLAGLVTRRNFESEWFSAGTSSSNTGTQV
jgi:lysozyme